MIKYVGVEQSDFGHDYRWIFDYETVKQKCGIDTELETWADVMWPIGGSNSSSTYFKPLKSGVDAIDFIWSCPSGPDAEDPTLVDLAEYYCTVAYGDDSITRLFDIDKSIQERRDIRYDKCLQMIYELGKCEGLDPEDPFYGESRNMRYSELCSLYKKYILDVKDYMRIYSFPIDCEYTEID